LPPKLAGSQKLEAQAMVMLHRNCDRAAFEVELYAYVKTGDWTEFTRIRQHVLLTIAKIVESSGTGFAGLTQLAYLSKDKGIDAQKANAITRGTNEARASDVVRFPGGSRTGTD
jgi:hypothetical protein